VGPRAGLDGCGKSRPTPGYEPPTVQLGESRYANYAIPDPNFVLQAIMYKCTSDLRAATIICQLKKCRFLEERKSAVSPRVSRNLKGEIKKERSGK